MTQTAPAALSCAVAARVASPLLWVHGLLIAFSTAALVTFLADPTPETRAWLAQEPNATVYRVAWQFSGPTYVVVGFLAALAHAFGRLGAMRVVAMFLVASSIALASELLGTSTGYPFGGYSYAWAMLRVVPPSQIAARVSPTRLPLVLYALNGVMPVAICFRYGLVWAGVLGTLAMALPVALAIRAGVRGRRSAPASRYALDGAPAPAD